MFELSQQESIQWFSVTIDRMSPDAFSRGLMPSTHTVITRINPHDVIQVTSFCEKEA
ncbi:hypothetical protein BJV74DRAFT_843548 [Russula compacta]|nr:hypothetical protein BJV74DRAFT_843548 [Russula compacta]